MTLYCTPQISCDTENKLQVKQKVRNDDNEKSKNTQSVPRTER